MATNVDKIQKAKARDEEEAAAEELREQETPEPEPEPEPTPEPEPEPGEPEPGEPSMERTAELEKANERYLKSLTKIFKPDPLPPLCPACQGTGLGFGDAEAAPSFVPHEAFIPCPTCEAQGKLATGSKVPGQEAVDCVRCGGRGYLEKLNQPAPVATNGEQATGGAEGYGVPSWAGDPSIRPQPPAIVS